MAFLVLVVLAGLEVDCMPQILTLFQNFHYRRGTPAVNILKSLVLVHALAMLGKIGRWDKVLFLGQFLGDLVGSQSVNGHLVDTLHDFGSFLVYNPLVSGLVPKIAVDDCPGQVLAGFALCLKGGTDFPACITAIKFVHDVPKRREIIVPSGTVHTHH